jgi:hypothetical protein
MKNLLLAFAAFLLLSVSGCNDNPANHDAQQTTLDEIKDNPSFVWFEDEFNSYEPDPAVIDSINHDFAAGEHKLIIFAKPSCSCNNDHNNFSFLMKVIHNSTIKPENYELYSMSDLDWDHPYADQVELMFLPEAVVMKNNAPVWTIVEEMKKYRQNHIDTISIEQSLMIGLRQ